MGNKDIEIKHENGVNKMQLLVDNSKYNGTIFILNTINTTHCNTSVNTKQKDNNKC